MPIELFAFGADGCLQLFPLWINHIEEPAKVAVEWPPPPPPILVQWPELPPTVVRDDIGGIIMKYTAHWQDLAATGDEVDILGPCLSACTLVVAYIPKDRLCFGQDASLQFHAAWERETGQMSLWATKWMVSKYPDDIRRWLALGWPSDGTPCRPAALWFGTFGKNGPFFTNRVLHFLALPGPFL